jgi:hypothetical protein
MAKSSPGGVRGSRWSSIGYHRSGRLSEGVLISPRRQRKSSLVRQALAALGPARRDIKVTVSSFSRASRVEGYAGARVARHDGRPRTGGCATCSAARGPNCGRRAFAGTLEPGVTRAGGAMSVSFPSVRTAHAARLAEKVWLPGQLAVPATAW